MHNRGRLEQGAHALLVACGEPRDRGVVQLLLEPLAARPAIAIFGVGSIVGMMAIGLTLSLPVVWSLTAGRRMFSAVQGFASLSSVGFGLWMLYRLLIAGGE